MLEPRPRKKVDALAIAAFLLGACAVYWRWSMFQGILAIAIYGALTVGTALLGTVLAMASIWVPEKATWYGWVAFLLNGAVLLSILAQAIISG